MLNTTDRIIKHKVGLLNLAEELGNVSKACKVMGLSRDTFYRYRSAVDEGGVEALLETTRRKPNLANRVDEATEQAVIASAIEYPAYGQLRTSNELRKAGVFISPSGVRSIWLRHGLENFKLRLKALEEKVVKDGIVLTESQVQAFEKKKYDDEACGEIETAHPGYLGSQDTFYVGTLKGVGRMKLPTLPDSLFYNELTSQEKFNEPTSRARYSAQDPPKEEHVPTEHFENAIDKAEQRLGLTGQPRAVVFHEKEGRRHAHAVWSRIDIEEMKAVQISYDHKKLKSLSRDLFLEHGWKMPRGLMDSRETDPRNFTLADWQQAKRSGKDPRAAKTAIQDAWAISDSRESFGHALQERGFVLARGDRRGHVAVDLVGEVRAIARQAGVKAKDVRARLGDENFLPSMDEAKDQIARKVLPTLKRFEDQLEQEKQTQIIDLKEQKQALIVSQRTERQAFLATLLSRQEQEAIERQARFRKGLGGVWDRLRGEHKQIQQRNEAEAQAALQRDRAEKDEIIQKQLTQRRDFSGQVQNKKQEYLQKRQTIERDIITYEQMRHPPSPEASEQLAPKAEYMRKRHASSVEHEPPVKEQTPPQDQPPSPQDDSKAAYLEKRTQQEPQPQKQECQPQIPTPER